MWRYTWAHIAWQGLSGDESTVWPPESNRGGPKETLVDARRTGKNLQVHGCVVVNAWAIIEVKTKRFHSAQKILQQDGEVSKRQGCKFILVTVTNSILIQPSNRQLFQAAGLVVWRKSGKLHWC
jgi:hypothetical protein